MPFSDEILGWLTQLPGKVSFIEVFAEVILV